MTAIAVFLGIDLTSSRRPYTYVALDAQRRLIAEGQAPVEEVLLLASSQQALLAAINSPSCPNRGLMQQNAVREKLDPPPPSGRWTNLRLVEYLLRKKGIKVALTPSTAAACPRWMQRGFDLFQRLQALGFEAYPSASGPHQWLEAQAEAAYWALLGRAPYDARSLEGRMQRQMLLYEYGLPLPDPMELFEEITPHRLLQGALPLKKIRSSCELNALAAAYTAWLAANRPAQVSRLGSPEEGEIVIPVTASHSQISDN